MHANSRYLRSKLCVVILSDPNLNCFLLHQPVSTSLPKYLVEGDNEVETHVGNCLWCRGISEPLRYNYLSFVLLCILCQLLCFRDTFFKSHHKAIHYYSITCDTCISAHVLRSKKKKSNQGWEVEEGREWMIGGRLRASLWV